MGDKQFFFNFLRFWKEFAICQFGDWLLLVVVNYFCVPSLRLIYSRPDTSRTLRMNWTKFELSERPTFRFRFELLSATSCSYSTHQIGLFSFISLPLRSVDSCGQNMAAKVKKTPLSSNSERDAEIFARDSTRFQVLDCPKRTEFVHPKSTEGINSHISTGFNGAQMPFNTFTTAMPVRAASSDRKKKNYDCDKWGEQKKNRTAHWAPDS